MRLKSIVPALFMAFAGAFAPASLAQDKPPAEAPVNPEVKHLAQGLIEQGLQASHAADIFSDARRTLREVYIPTLRDMVQGDFPGMPAPDPKTAGTLAKLLTFMNYLRKAGDELDVALSENREAMISDAAEQIARTAKPAEIRDVQGVLQLPAVRKGFDAFYAVTKLLTGFSYEDSRTFSEFSAWVETLNFDLEHMPGTPGRAVPSKHQIAKAQALMDDLINVSHLDEMVADVKRFMREVYAEIAPMSEEDRQELRGEIDQWEFTYNMQKAVILAAAPSALAAALTGEQLDTLHGFLRTPAFARVFGLLRDAVKAGTAFTKEDILEAQKSFEDIEEKSKLRERSPGEEEKAKAEWNALAEKWQEILKNSMSPDTRSGLERSLKDLQDEGSPI
ncbi:MAG: hypothetical protein HY765_01435 [Rhodomicrobium sp.]|nr:hypothetical protein [Rhodomicrobium sp.]